MNNKSYVRITLDRIFNNSDTAEEFINGIISEYDSIPVQYRSLVDFNTDYGIYDSVSYSFGYYRDMTEDELRVAERQRQEEDKTEFELFKKLKLKYEVK